VWGAGCGALDARNILFLALSQLDAARFQKPTEGGWLGRFQHE